MNTPDRIGEPTLSLSMPDRPHPIIPIPRLSKMDKISRLVASVDGLGSVLMLVEYSSPLVVLILIHLARMRRSFRLGEAKQSGLIRAAGGWSKVGNSLSEAQVVMRLAGMISIYKWLVSLYPKPLQSIQSLLRSRGTKIAPPTSQDDSNGNKIIPTIQALSLGAFFPAEHIMYLAGHGVLNPARRLNRISGKVLLSAWSIFVAAQINQLVLDGRSLWTRGRTKQHCADDFGLADLLTDKTMLSEDESDGMGSPLSDNIILATREARQDDTLADDVKSWAINVFAYAGWVPLTAHWMSSKGLGPMNNPHFKATVATWTAFWSLAYQYNQI